MPRTKKGKEIIFILFGATGDLALRYIFPALERLFNQGEFSADSKIIAVSRRDWNDSDFAKFLEKSSEDFKKLVSYSKVDVEKNEGYSALRLKIDSFRKGSEDVEILIHLSLSPFHQAQAIQSICQEGIFASRSVKLLTEKPFGSNEQSAKELDALLDSCLGEDQIYRIDHYLGKDTVQAIMNLHESTPDFSHTISKESVSSIRVALLEKIGIEGRGATYDKVGAFRDVGQNHVLEMLAVVAADIKEKSWQEARAEVLNHLTPPANTCELSRRGQYVGFTAESGVAKNSETETAFEVTTNLRDGKLVGVPFVLQSGKKMAGYGAFIEVYFKKVEGMPKRMRFSLQPEQEILIEYEGGKIESFDIPRQNDAYTNIIKAALKGSSREFVGREEIEALWRYADRVVACWDKVPLEIYSDEKPFLIQ